MKILLAFVALYFVVAVVLFCMHYRTVKTFRITRYRLIFSVAMWPLTFFATAKRIINVYLADRALLKIAKRRINEIY